MLQGFYSAVTGAQQQMLRMDVQANNISNVNTNGFRAQVPAFQALMYGMLDGIDGSQLPRGSGGQPDPTLPLPIISDGRLLLHNLRDSGFSYEWLTKQLKKHGFAHPHQVFFLSVDNRGTVVCIGKEGIQ